jgi:hypothetical protein
VVKRALASFFLPVLEQVQINFIIKSTDTVKPVLRGHLWDKEKYPFKTGDLLKEVQFI